jgi:two-component system, chemotaxis family, response regulator Rcp1
MIGPIRILLVDDDPGDVRLTQEALKADKVYCQSDVAANGIEALAYLRQEGRYAETTPSDLVLLDLNMPHKDGREVLREIRADPDLNDIPVVVLTGSQAEEDRCLAEDLGAVCYVTKPVDLQQFTKIVQSLQALWFSMVALPPGLSSHEWAVRRIS